MLHVAGTQTSVTVKSHVNFLPDLTGGGGGATGRERALYGQRAVHKEQGEQLDLTGKQDKSSENCPDHSKLGKPSSGKTKFWRNLMLTRYLEPDTSVT